MGKELRQRFMETKMALRSITGEGTPHLLASRGIVDKNGFSFPQKGVDTVASETRSVNLRNALIMPLNLMQVRCLRETRNCATAANGEDAKQLLDDTLLITVKGISA